MFGSRDVWFVVALPVYLASSFGWEHVYVSGFIALWIVGYGLVQALAPKLSGTKNNQAPSGQHALRWALLLCAVPFGIGLCLSLGIYPQQALIGGLMLFGALFAINSSLHSYLIVSYASDEGVSLDVGFYYMANAMGRLLGTILSGYLFQAYGLATCLYVSAAFIAITAIISLGLPKHHPSQSAT